MTFVSGSCNVDVRGLRVLVTAGASGIGRAIAEAFVAAGAHVHISDIAEDAVGEAVSTVSGLTGSTGDASDPRNADQIFRDIVARFDGLDVLVNNVGIPGPTGGIDAFADADVERTIDVNLKSHFYTLNRCVPLLKTSKNNASIVGLSSVAGRIGYGYRTPYAATKWAIVGLIKSLAIELGPNGIRANAILPGAVKGARMDRVIADRAATLGMSFEDMLQTYLSQISLRRMIEAEDVANLALFLSSNLARNISGQAISVDGNFEGI